MLFAYNRCGGGSNGNDNDEDEPSKGDQKIKIDDFIEIFILQIK